MHTPLAALSVTVLSLAMGCAPAPRAPEGTAWDFRLPANVPLPSVPADNALTVEKFELGRRLFYEQRLSVNGTVSCGSCHRQSLAFTDGLAQSIGATGDRTPRNSMTLVGAGYLPTLTWFNPVLDSLERQALVPLLGENPVEHGLSGREAATLASLAADPTYRSLFERAFPQDSSPVTLVNVTRALASFQRALVSADAPYDRYTRGETDALSESAQRGLELFNSERLECYHCHAGPTFTTAFRSARTQTAPRSFENNGLYNLDVRGSYPPASPGLSEFTGDPRDHGRMRVPTLRNIAVTAPYMHDGSIATLDGVIEHYMRGGTNHTSGPFVGDGRLNPNKSPLVRGFALTPSERQDLLAFLRALTDESFLRDPRFSDPFASADAGARDP
jgi:cytochrome c peroxidase